MRHISQFPRRIVLLLACLLGLALTTGAQARGGPPLVLTWLADGDLLSDAQLSALLGKMSQAQAHPDHIVLFVHGYMDTQKDSAEIYTPVSKLFDRAFRSAGRRELIVGVQWHAASPGNKSPISFMPEYLKGVTRARRVGHGPLRQLVAASQSRFPGARIDLLTHSLGAEAGVACLYPDLKYPDTLEKSEVWHPQQNLQVNQLVLALADLDYDIWYQSKVSLLRPRPVARQLWLTVTPYVGGKDEALIDRAQLRGKQAATRFPRMTAQQYDGLFKNRAVFFDDRAMEHSHQFVDYFNQERVNRIVGNALYVGGDGREPGEMAQVDQVLAGPRDPKALSRWLDSPNMAPRTYALWRIENLMDKSSAHFEDETIDDVHLLLKNTPRKVWDERKSSKCSLVRSGLFPTEKEMTRAGAPHWAENDR